MGLEWECVLLQGLRSALPRYTPAYDLAAPNGAVYWTPMDIFYPFDSFFACPIDENTIFAQDNQKLK